MLPTIVRKMPFILHENFERLSTQLNMLAHTADLEAKDEQTFEDTLKE